jgi:titin
VEGNFIGTDATGMVAVPNNFGIELFGRAAGTTIGGTTPEARNIVSGNLQGGIFTSLDLGGGGNLIQGNFIGTNVAGAALGNGGQGISLAMVSGSGGAGTTIGGTAAGAGNVIAFNGLNGVVISGLDGDAGNVNNAVLSNSIFGNGRLGIDLTSFGSVLGATPNDPADADEGPNHYQNFPVISSVTSSAGSTTINGTLNSTPGQSFLLQFFKSDAPGHLSFGEGQTLIGSIQTGLTDSSTGDVSFTAAAHFRPLDRS